MDDKYQKKIQKMQLFEKWDREYQKNLSVKEKLNQFEILYSSGCDLFSRKMHHLHDLHLKGLIEVQKELKR